MRHGKHGEQVEVLSACQCRFRQLAESLPQLVWQCRVDGTCDYLSPQWLEYTGIPETEQLGKGWLNQLHPEDSKRTITAWSAAVATASAFDTEFRIRRSDGVYRWFSTRAVPLLDTKGRMTKWVGSNTDIEERKRAEESLQLARSELEQRIALRTKELRKANEDLLKEVAARKLAEASREQMRTQLLQAQKLESIGTLAGVVAHEINNPIMGIMGYTQLILDRLGPHSPVSEYASEIGKETERVASIVKNLLSFARQDEEAQRSPAGLCDIVEDTLSLIRAVMRHDQTTLEVNVPADLPKILCRSQQIRQVLMNLLTNARDTLNQKYPGHDENKRIVISARLISDLGFRISESGEKEEVAGDGIRHSQSAIRITVEDHGTGIPRDLRSHIFNPFFSTKPRNKGTGLGLSISHGIVSDHGGTLSVESEVGQWTRFHVDLPVGQDRVSVVQ